MNKSRCSPLLLFNCSLVEETTAAAARQLLITFFTVCSAASIADMPGCQLQLSRLEVAQQKSNNTTNSPAYFLLLEVIIECEKLLFLQKKGLLLLFATYRRHVKIRHHSFFPSSLNSTLLQCSHTALIHWCVISSAAAANTTTQKSWRTRRK